MPRKQFGRLMTAMITPFDRTGAVNIPEAVRIAQWLVDRGNDGLIVCGTTGESPALEDAEKLALFAAVKEGVGNRATVIAGTGGNNTRHSIELTREAERCGVDGVLAVVPYYNKPTQDGMIRHFGAIAEATDLPIIIYNIPSRTGSNMLPATLLGLARQFDNIAGVKESSGDCAQFSAILRERKTGFGFWSGDDYMFLPSLALGGEGVISVAGHVCGPQLRKMMEAHDAGDPKSAAQIHRDLSPLFSALFATTSPIPVKWAMGEFGFDVGACRSPLGVMPEPLKEILRPLIAPYRPTEAALARS
ncbi:MAG TPA: 4-hydroxy-tetrahydrodipicolinate synthase [Candidatus Binatia bacterium]|nr:4-hydroxy-tetrahydrodipicolinate synthase [Candidatus Binatia bacterium]